MSLTPRMLRVARIRPWTCVFSESAVSRVAASFPPRHRKPTSSIALRTASREICYYLRASYPGRLPAQCHLRRSPSADNIAHPNSSREGTMATQPSPNPNEELVEVFGAKEESEVLIVKGLLESAGIDALVSSLDAPQDVLPGVGGLIIRVPAEQAEEARQVIEDYRLSAEEEAGLTDEAEAADEEA